MEAKQPKNWILWIMIAAVMVVVGVSIYQAGKHSTKTASKSSPSPRVSATATASPVAPSSGVTPPPAGPAIQRCHTPALSASLSAAGAAAGTSYQTLSLTNKTNAPCTMTGYPGVSLVDAAGKQLGQPAERSGSNGGATVTVAPGAAAYSLIGFPNPGNFNPGACSAPSHAMLVYPPNETQALSVVVTEQACPGFAVGAITLTHP